MKDKTVDVFFALLRAGLWSDGNPEIRIDGTTDWQEVYRLATEQSVIGLVLAGIEAVQGSWLKVNGSPLVPQMLLLQWIGEVQILEQRNKAMNAFVAELIEKLRKEDVYALLVKGQGVAQCYEKPLWRACGDVDLLLNKDNYNKAKSILVSAASEVANEDEATMHQALVINGFDVELHGKMPFIISKRVDDGINEVLEDLFYRGNVRSWNCNGTQVFLPSPDNDVILVFTHFLHHFFIEGVGLRQICDWCRLLYRYRSELDLQLLESRIKRMGLMSEWKVFGAFAVEYLGMPADAVPLLDVRSLKEDVRWRRKADRICSFIMEVGNMGHNRDSSYYVKYPYVIRKAFSFSRRLGDLYRHARIFPLDSFRFLPTLVFNGVRSAIKGE